MENKFRGTTIEELKQINKSEVIELPGFLSAEGKNFYPKVKRVSLLGLATAGLIPNELLGAVSSLYMNGVQGQRDIRDTARAFQLIAQLSLVSPSYEEIEKAGLELTDEQLLHIYLYATGGVRSYAVFRKE